MFKRSFRSNQDAGRVDKAGRLTKRSGSVRDPQKMSRLQRSLTEQQQQQQQYHDPGAPPPETATHARSKSSVAPSPIVTLTVGREGRLFAAHEDVLRQAPFFEAACRDHHFRDAQSKRISLPDEEPEVFSAVLEYLYKGDYYPRLMHNRSRNSWELEDARGALPTPRSSPHPDPHHYNHHYNSGRAAASPMSAKTTLNTPTTPASGMPDATVFVAACGEHLLRDTVIYCAAERYGLEELKKLALRKQGLQAGIDVATILRSAQYAYAHTPDTDSRLRAHYLALIIRCRKTFKRSGTMQAEMERGGSKLYFDLFVAMCNHLDDVIDVSNARSPRTV